LGSAIEDAQRGTGSIVVLEGAAGIGKSRLLAEVVSTAGRAGLRTALAATDELDELAPLASLLAGLRAATPPMVPPDLLDGLAAYADQRLALLDRLGACLEDHARDDALLIALDDLQWADATTLLALRVLTVQLTAYPVVWVLARRPQPTSPALERTIEQLVGRGAHLHPLAPLQRDAVADVVSDLIGAPPDESMTAFLDGVDGSPFYLSELLRAMNRDGALVVDDGVATIAQEEIPRGFRDTTAARLATLSARTREFIGVASIFGRRCRVDDVADILDRTPGQLAGAVGEALAHDLIVEEGDELVFSHDLLREAVYRNVPVSLREAIHLQIARRLLDRGAAPADAAAHLAVAPLQSDAATVALVQDAADDLIARAPAAAAELKLRLVDALPPGSPDWSRATGDALRLLAITGQSRQAEELARAALERYLDPAARAALQLGLAHALQTLGFPRLVRPVVHELLDTPDISDDTRIAALGVLAAATIRTGATNAAAAVEAERELATRLASTEHIINNLGNRSHLLARSGELDQALDLVVEETTLAERSAPAVSTARAPRLGSALHLMMLDRTDEARRELELAEQEARAIGYPWAISFCEQSRAATFLIEGQLDNAATLAESTLEDVRAVDLEPRACEALHILALIALRRGDDRTALVYIDRLDDLVERGAALIVSVHNSARGKLTFAEGDAVGALAELDAVYEAPYLTTLLRADCPLAPDLVRIAMAAGSDDRAQSMASEARTYARRNPGVASIVAQAEHAAGLLDQDVDLLRAATRSYARSPRMLARAVAEEDLANALADNGEQEEATELLRSAAHRYMQLGARRDADRVRARLRALGVRLRTTTAAERPTTGWDALTPAEQTIARLAGEALTNRQIAERLYLSPHTVTTHLRHIFAKLDIHSRVELAHAVPD
jgi:DNA-binding CsgD family transcriptional regulator